MMGLFGLFRKYYNQSLLVLLIIGQSFNLKKMNIINTLLPLYLLISLGYFFKRVNFPSADFWPGVEKLVYYVMFPALIFSNLNRAEIETQLFGQIFFAIVLPTVLAGGMQWLGLFNTSLSRATFSSMFQGAVRNNTTIGLVIAGLILPGQGVAIIAVIMTVMVIINNISCVTVLSYYGKEQISSDSNPNSKSNSSKNQSTLHNIIQNPLIVASLLGLVLNLLSIKTPDTLHNTIYFLGQTGLPLALLTVGAGLNLNTFYGKALAIGLSTFAKMIVTPIVVYFIVQFMGMSPTTMAMFILYGALPTAMSSYVLASQMGGDEETMAQIITVQTLVTAITIPVVLWVIKDLL